MKIFQSLVLVSAVLAQGKSRGKGGKKTGKGGKGRKGQRGRAQPLSYKDRIEIIVLLLVIVWPASCSLGMKVLIKQDHNLICREMRRRKLCKTLISAHSIFRENKHFSNLKCACVLIHSPAQLNPPILFLIACFSPS